MPREGIEREECLFAKESQYCIRRVHGALLSGWDETSVGAAGDETPVEMPGAESIIWRYAYRLNLPNRRVRDPYARWCGREEP